MSLWRSNFEVSTGCNQIVKSCTEAELKELTSATENIPDVDCRADSGFSAQPQFGWDEESQSIHFVGGSLCE